ncbi:MAG: hypothetical protein WCL50_01945, partial [Spirochaetota bacterium]
MVGMSRVGLVTFDFPPQYKRADLAARPTATGSALVTGLLARSVEVVVPAEELVRRDPGAAGGIRDAKDLAFCVDLLRSQGVQCLIIEVYHWARLSLVTRLVDELDLPVAIYAVTTGGWNGVPCSTAISGGLHECPRTLNGALAEAFLGPDIEDLLRWIRGTTALTRMRASRVMLWGGGYGAEMPYSRGDPATLEALLLGEVMTEQEEVLVRRAKAMLEKDPLRVADFLTWLSAKGARVERDGRMVNQGSLNFQSALYLAARDRIAELEGDGLSIAGVTIKCHYEMSITCQGCTACFLPAFLPFGTDSEGPRPVVPTACEGDLAGLASLVLLHELNPAVPPLFGDLVSYRRDHVLLRNCGASSVYWAGLSGDAGISLPLTSLRPNLHGTSGAAVQYETPACDEVTFARLFRQEGRYAMLVGQGRILAGDETSKYDNPWPHTRLS